MIYTEQELKRKSIRDKIIFGDNPPENDPHYQEYRQKRFTVDRSQLAQLLTKKFLSKDERRADDVGMPSAQEYLNFMKSRPQFKVIGEVLDRDNYTRKDKDDCIELYGIECNTSAISDKEFAATVCDLFSNDLNLFDIGWKWYSLKYKKGPSSLFIERNRISLWWD